MYPICLILYLLHITMIFVNICIILYEHINGSLTFELNLFNPLVQLFIQVRLFCYFEENIKEFSVIHKPLKYLISKIELN